MDKVICQNCGASIYENEPACPFCGFINMEGAEDKFMRDVQKKEEELTQIPQLQKQDLKKSMSKSSKIIIITVLIAATILAVLFDCIMRLRQCCFPRIIMMQKQKCFGNVKTIRF